MTTQDIASLNERIRPTPPMRVVHQMHDILLRAVDSWLQWRTRRATVRILEGMDDRMLRDIGMTRTEIHAVVFGNVDVNERTCRHHRTWD